MVAPLIIPGLGSKSNLRLTSRQRIYTDYFAAKGNPNPMQTKTEVNCPPMPMAVEVKAVAHVPRG